MFREGRPAMTMTRRIGAAIWLVIRVLFVAGLIALAYATYVVIDAMAYQAIEHRRLEQVAPDAVGQAALPDESPASGSRMRNSLPWPTPSLRASMLPPCRSTISRATLSPMPSPVSPSGCTCENRSNT